MDSCHAVRRLVHLAGKALQVVEASQASAVDMQETDLQEELSWVGSLVVAVVVHQDSPAVVDTLQQPAGDTLAVVDRHQAPGLELVA